MAVAYYQPLPTSGKPTLPPSKPVERRVNCVYVQHAIPCYSLPSSPTDLHVQNGTHTNGTGTRKRWLHTVQPCHPLALGPRSSIVARAPLAGSPRAQLEHAVTEASSTCFLEIDTLPSHGRHAHHRRPRQPSESRSSPVDDPSCPSSSSLSCSLLLSSTLSSFASVL